MSHDAHSGMSHGTMAQGTTAQGTIATAATTPASGQIVAPGNTNPERDARGIPVISEAAVVPSGWNGMSGAAVGGPLVDPATGEAGADADYPACSRTVTDNCVQRYERGV